jgi:hypothetical protein
MHAVGNNDNVHEIELQSSHKALGVMDPDCEIRRYGFNP